MPEQIIRYDVYLRDFKQDVRDTSQSVEVPTQSTTTPLSGYFQARIFFVKGQLNQTEINRLGELLVDPVTEAYHLTIYPQTPHIDSDHYIEVALLPGVTDPVAENLVRAARLIGINGIEQAATGLHYSLQGDFSNESLEHLALSEFSNPVIQTYEIDSPIMPPFVDYEMADDTVDSIPIRDADNNRLLAISAERMLALDLSEMQAIQTYYRSEGRDPSDLEIEMLAQTWSEHCIHKTFRANISYIGPEHGAAPDSEPVEQEVQGLLKTYLRAATDKINKSWIRSAFVDNAGIIAFDESYDLAFKVETHNHPSAIEPFGGANTGVGGVVRDVLGVSARPIANTDVLCFGTQDLPEDKLPGGTLHPHRIQDGVVHGVEDYGNKMGIPTVNGAVLYHENYVANPLVFCGCLGILPHGTHPTGANPGDLIVVIGGRTGRDGLRGATFSSMEMDGSTGTVAGSSVQIGNPIQEKKVQEVVLLARDQKLYSAITDCGAGGLSSAVGEMGQDTGAEVQLDTVPLKYSGLRPWEIWLSEAQERMVLAIPSENWQTLEEICAIHDVEATCIGTFNASGRMSLYYGEKLVGEMSMKFLHEGIPTRNLEAVWQYPEFANTEKQPKIAIDEAVLKLLAHPNIRSKENIVRQYDHEVQGGTIVKPFVGVENQAPSDAAVLIPLDTEHKTERGVAISNGICPQFGELDPYAMAFAAIDEAVRNAVAVGANPDQIAILDNFCWGNPNLPDRLGSLVRCVQGCYDAAIAYGAPYISGKDSLNNEFADENGQRHAIPGTLLISAVGIVPDIQSSMTMDLKHSGNVLYLIGETREELGGSHYHMIQDIDGGQVPQPQPQAMEIMRTLHRAINENLLESVHDLSEGGLVVALAEMAIGGNLGVKLDLSAYDTVETSLFSESLSRFIVEVSPENEESLKSLFADLPLEHIGTVSDTGKLEIETKNQLVSLELAELEKAWRGEAPQSYKAPKSEAQNAVLAVSSRTTKPRVLIMHANGTNRDREAALACELAGGEPEIVHINQLLQGERQILDYQMLLIPGGFSYGDDLGAGVLWALDMQTLFKEQVTTFVESGRPVLGICNGFQTLVKSNLLPGIELERQRSVTLTHNESGKFECRWVHLQANPNSNNLFTNGLDELIYCPVAHGEGRIAVRDEAALQMLWDEGLVALTYVNADGSSAIYPNNPNGSAGNIAGLSNKAGNVMGLMPHPEDHIFAWQHPRWKRGESGNLGLSLFKNAIKNA